jgi:hypothetical protein
MGSAIDGGSGLWFADRRGGAYLDGADVYADAVGALIAGYMVGFGVRGCIGRDAGRGGRRDG